MKNWSNEKKKRLVYFITAILISVFVLIVIANLGIIKSNAADFENYEISEEQIFIEIDNEKINYEIMQSNRIKVSTDIITINKSTNAKYSNLYFYFLYIPTFGNVLNGNTYITISYYNYNNGSSGGQFYNSEFIERGNYKLGVAQLYVGEQDFTDAYFVFDSTNVNNIENFAYSTVQHIIVTTEPEYGLIVAYNRLKELNNINGDVETETETEEETETETPLTEVFGTDEFIKTENESYNHYTINNLVPKNWTDFYAGFIGRVQAADGTSVPIYYNWAVDGLQYGDGEITVLDPTYHDYIKEINITGSITNGTIELDASKQIEIVYFAISGNYNNLSTHLVEKVNEYQLAADQIQAAYNEGYKNGYIEGVNVTQMGAFGDAELIVYFQFVEDSTGTVINKQVNFPFNVNTGGISFENVWNWYMNSEWNRSGISVYYVEFDIVLYDTGVLWSDTMFRFGVEGDTITSDMMPYSVQVTTIETVETSQTTGIWHNVSLTKTGDYYYLTNSELDGYHVDMIRFYINAQNLSYYEQLITNKLTLYNNLGEYTMNVKSFNAGYNNGYDVGYINGEKDGIATQQTLSFNEGKAAGFVEGKEVGYTNGYSDGMRDDFKFYELFFSLFDAQLNTFKSVVSFEIFGINVAGFVLGLVTIGIVAFVIKKVW